MTRESLVPISRLGNEALAARIVHAASSAHQLAYFSPVAQTPGFARALAKTIAELRLNRVTPNALGHTGAAGKDLAQLLNFYESELAQRSLADLPMLLELATEEARSKPHRLLNLPLLFFNIPVDSLRHREFLAALAEKSPHILATAIAAENPSLPALESILQTTAEDLDPPPSTTLDRVRTWLFSAEQPPSAPPDPSLLFSAPGESLECVEIARRVLVLAQNGTPFDRIAVLLRNVEQYQP